jgi:hypothetical protein
MSKKWIVILVSFFVLSGCDKMAEYYAGMHLQPSISRDDFTPGLNVFGIIKAGFYSDSANHHVEVLQLQYINDSNDTLIVSGATVLLTCERVSGERIEYALNYWDEGKYNNNTIETAPGDKWDFRCIYDTVLVTASCIVPNVPYIDKTSSNMSDNSLNISLMKDSTAFLYDVYLVDGENFLAQKKKVITGEASKFDFQTTWKLNKETAMLFVFAYDSNMRKYQTTSNTFFKPNSFRPAFTTVDGGYGTFGAVTGSLYFLRDIF